MLNTPNVIAKIAYAMPLNEIAAKRMSPAKKIKYLGERNFYGCNQAEDYIKYVHTGIAESDIVGYSGNSEKSSGIFDENGLLNKKDRAALRKMLRTAKGNIWHNIISFKEVFGNKHMRGYEDACELLKSELPLFFRSIALNPKNVVWFAGLHKNTDNAHIHFSFFEKRPLFYSQRNNKVPHYRYGKINSDAIDKFKVSIEERLTDATFDLKQSRKAVTQRQKETLTVALLGHSDFDSKLRKKLQLLYQALPTEGRVSYNSINMKPLRSQVKDIVNFIIKNTSVKPEFEQFCRDCVMHDDKVKEICCRQKIEDVSKLLKGDKYIDDVYRRLGDQVIRSVFILKAKERKECQKCKRELAKKHVERRYKHFLLDYSSKICKEIDDEAVRCFENYRRSLETAEYLRLVEEGVIEAE